MLLRTLGGLALEGSDFTRPKPLLLLAYLAIEGPKDRRYLADLFWGSATDGLNRLSTALTRARKSLGGAIGGDSHRVWTDVACDAPLYLTALKAGDTARALELYRGPFLDGVYRSDWGEELEEWVYRTREYLAGGARGILLELAEREAAEGDHRSAAHHAEAAYRLSGAAEPEPDELPRFHRLLLAGGSPLAAEVRREAGDFGLEVSGTPEEARSRLLAGTETSATDSPRNRPARSLPSQSTPFIGRERELGELRELLAPDSGHRLVTLLGPGGIGKTRLALAAASELAGSFEHGVCFVVLTEVGSRDRFLAAIAKALGLQPHNGDLGDRIGDYLRPRELLLVLDDFEHALDQASVAVELLEAAPRLRIVATSRERLGLGTETVCTVTGLGYAVGGAGGEAESDSLRLLRQRARLVRPGLELQGDDLVHALRICRLVEGMPLAIVLAAGWLELLSLEEIAHEVARSLNFLETGMRDVPPRQRSVRAVFDYSWGRLTPQEQQAFAGLSAFRDGFSREAAGLVAGAGLGTLGALVHKSLLYTRAAGRREGRFEIHEVLRQYGAEKLAEGDGGRDVLERHATYFLGMLARSAGDLVGRGQIEACRSLFGDYRNLAAAWRRAGEFGEEGLIAVAAVPFYELHMLGARYVEGYEAFREAADLLAGSGSSRSGLVASLRCRGAAFLAARGEFQAAREILEKHLPELSSAADEAFAFETLGHSVLYFQGEVDAGLERLRESLALYREIADEYGVARALFFTGALLWHKGEYGQVEGLIEESHALFRRLGNPSWTAHTMAGLGVLRHVRGDGVRAKALLEEALERLLSLGQHHSAANAASNLGITLVESGDAAGGLAQLKTALRLFEEVGDPVLTCETHFRIGEAHLVLGDRAAAEEHFRLSLAMSLEHGFESVGALIGFADLIGETDPEQALALYLFVTEHESTALAERGMANAHLRALRPRPGQLVRARRRASEFEFRQAARKLLGAKRS